MRTKHQRTNRSVNVETCNSNDECEASKASFKGRLAVITIRKLSNKQIGKKNGYYTAPRTRISEWNMFLSSGKHVLTTSEKKFHQHTVTLSTKFSSTFSQKLGEKSKTLDFSFGLLTTDPGFLMTDPGFLMTDPELLTTALYSSWSWRRWWGLSSSLVLTLLMQIIFFWITSLKTIKTKWIRILKIINVSVTIFTSFIANKFFLWIIIIPLKTIKTKCLHMNKIIKRSLMLKVLCASLIVFLLLLLSSSNNNNLLNLKPKREKPQHVHIPFHEKGAPRYLCALGIDR